MRAFIVLCLVAVVYAQYDYQVSGGTSGSFGGSLGGGSVGGGSLSGLGGGLGVGSSFGGSLGGGSFGVGSSFSGGIGGDSLGGGSSFGGGLGGGSLGGSSSFGGDAGGVGGGVVAVGGGSEFSKEFYSFSAPEYEFNDDHSAQDISSSLKKNLRVIFIKGPENNGLENAALSLAKHASEQRTAVYVLQKQADVGELAHRLNSIQSSSHHKPEVHFVKYRTHEDAANAQRQIQSQYDQLGGSSSSHNGGVAPVLNFASQGTQVHHAAPSAPSSSYLPASIFRRRV